MLLKLLNYAVLNAECLCERAVRSLYYTLTNKPWQLILANLVHKLDRRLSIYHLNIQVGSKLKTHLEFK